MVIKLNAHVWSTHYVQVTDLAQESKRDQTLSVPTTRSCLTNHPTNCGTPPPFIALMIARGFRN